MGRLSSIAERWNPLRREDAAVDKIAVATIVLATVLPLIVKALPPAKNSVDFQLPIVGTYLKFDAVSIALAPFLFVAWFGNRATSWWRWTMVVGWILIASVVAASLRQFLHAGNTPGENIAVAFSSAADGPEPTHAALAHDIFTWVATLVAVLIFPAATQLLLGRMPVSEHSEEKNMFRTRLFSENRAERVRTLLFLIGLCLFVAMIWPPGGPATLAGQFVDQGWGLDASSWAGPVLSWVIQWCVLILYYIMAAAAIATVWSPLWAATGIQIWWCAIRLEVTNTAAIFSLAGVKHPVFRIPWEKVKRAEYISHGNNRPELILRYTTRFQIPFTIGLHAKHYADGEQAISMACKHLNRHNVPVRQYYSSRAIPWIASLLMLGGLLVALMQLWRWNDLWVPYMRPDFESSHYADLLAPIELAVLSVLPVVLIGISLGLMSAFHRGSPRPILAGAWVLTSSFFPYPLIHWLVWIAIYAIHDAMLQPLSRVPNLSDPNWSQFYLAIDLVNLIPLFAGVAYLLGLFIGKRRITRPHPELPLPSK